MSRNWFRRAIVLGLGVIGAAGLAAQQQPPPKPVPAPAPAAAPAAAPATPVILVDTVKGAIEIELFPADAPKSVGHILALVRKGFYRGLRFHRVVSALAQFGDPLTRNMTYRDGWGTGGSGQPIGVAEISKRHSHVRGTVGLAYSGSAVSADSQLYIMKSASPSLDGKYAIVGQVTKGMDVVDRVEETDLIKNVSVKGEPAK
jgi:cyclophilin family peptidyl-prolyl cis-trans isomerase